MKTIGTQKRVRFSFAVVFTIPRFPIGPLIINHEQMELSVESLSCFPLFLSLFGYGCTKQNQLYAHFPLSPQADKESETLLVLPWSCHCPKYEHRKHTMTNRGSIPIRVRPVRVCVRESRRWTETSQKGELRGGGFLFVFDRVEETIHCSWRSVHEVKRV